jgi:hypothetical protein
MNCVACGLRSSYNRAVVDTVNDVEVGVLCPGCEADHFGQRLAAGEFSDGECLLCDRDGFFALPEWRAYVVETDGRRVARSEYSLAPPSPHLCDAHFEAIADDRTADRGDRVRTES